jgi:hypothetical protein
MNSTEIFYNSGQLNWDAINTISNIVLVAALVLITAWYVHEIRKQTRLMIKDRERTKVLEEVQDVLTPAINHIKSEIDAIQNKKISWHRYTSGGCGFDSGLGRLYYSTQYGPVTPELKERLEEMIKEFNKEKSATYRLTGEPIANAFGFYGGYLINLEYTIKRIPDSIQPHIDFWEEHQDELLKFRDKPHIIEIHKQICKKLIQLKELDDEIFKKLVKIREEYRKEYNFINDEIEPFRGL